MKALPKDVAVKATRPPSGRMPEMVDVFGVCPSVSVPNLPRGNLTTEKTVSMVLVNDIEDKCGIKTTLQWTLRFQTSLLWALIDELEDVAFAEGDVGEDDGRVGIVAAPIVQYGLQPSDCQHAHRFSSGRQCWWSARRTARRALASASAAIGPDDFRCAVPIMALEINKTHALSQESEWSR